MLLFTRPQKMNGLVVRRSRSLYCSVCFGTRVSLSMAYEYPGSIRDNGLSNWDRKYLEYL